MNTRGDIIQRFHAAIPVVREWIDGLLSFHANHVRNVRSLRFERLAICWPRGLLERTKVIEVARVPFPPVKQLGLPELAPVQQMQFTGITFKDTFFLLRGQASESLCFHELVHVVQWARLGVDNFLFAYGIGLIQHGYEQSPLEQMAYKFQRNFEEDTLSTPLVRDIEEQTDAIWKVVAPIVQKRNAGA